MKCVEGQFLVEGKGDNQKVFPVVRVLMEYRQRKKLAVFVIDTGATITMINYYDAKLLGLYDNDVPKRTVPIKKAGGREDKEYVLNNPITFKFLGKDGKSVFEVKAKNVVFPKSQPKDRNIKQAKLLNLLGWDVLKELAVKLDFGSDLVELCKRK